MDDSFKLVFSDELVVRWGDMDAFGHVNNARYLSYLEHVRVNWLESLAIKDLGRPRGPVMVTADLTFIKPIFYPATMNIKLYLGEPGNSSFMTFHEIFVGDDLCATSHVKVVWVDHDQNKSVRFPAEIRELF